MRGLARNERNANEVTVWVMQIHKNVLEIMSSTKAGMENNVYMWTINTSQ